MRKFHFGKPFNQRDGPSKRETGDGLEVNFENSRAWETDWIFSLFQCVFIPGGGFELGHYECCCQIKNASSTSGWLWQRHSYKSRQLQRLLLQKYEQCMDGRLVEQEVTLGRTFPGHCIDYVQNDYALRRVLLSINILCALAAFALIFVVTTQRKVKVSFLEFLYLWTRLATSYCVNYVAVSRYEFE